MGVLLGKSLLAHESNMGGLISPLVINVIATLNIFLVS